MALSLLLSAVPAYLKLPTVTCVCLWRKPEDSSAVHHRVHMVLEFGLGLGSSCGLQLFPGPGKCLAQCPVLLSDFFIIKLLKGWKQVCLFCAYVSWGQDSRRGIWWQRGQDRAPGVSQVQGKSHLLFTGPCGSVW